MRRFATISTFRLSIGHATDRGLVREENEDSYLVLTAPIVAPELTALLVVADGMGGHRAGAVASAEVVQRLNQLFTSSRYQKAVDYDPTREDYFLVVVKQVLEQLNDQLYNESCSRSDLTGMGTTTSLALLTSGQVYVGHVGDSRIYRLRAGNLQQLTQDHRWVTEKLLAGEITPEQAAKSDRRNVLTRCLGYNLQLRVDRAVHDVQLGDRLLLCSDGLHEVVSDAEIGQYLASAVGPQATCTQLIDLALRRGGPDNISVLVAHVIDGEGNDLPDGRAYGPIRQEPDGEQAITVKILPLAGRPALPGVRRAREHSRLGAALRWVLIGVLGCLGALICAVVASLALKLPLTALASPGDPTVKARAVFVALIVVAMWGIAIGLALSRLILTSRRTPHGASNSNGPVRTETEIKPDHIESEKRR